MRSPEATAEIKSRMIPLFMRDAYRQTDGWSKEALDQLPHLLTDGDFFDLLRRGLDGLNKEVWPVYQAFSDEARVVIADPDYFVQPRQRSEVLRHYVRRLGRSWWLKDETRENYEKVFEKDQYGYSWAAGNLWEGLGYQVLIDAQDEEKGIVLRADEVSISRDYLIGYLNNYFSRFRCLNIPERVQACFEAINRNLWPLGRQPRDRLFFDTPAVFFWLASAGFLCEEGRVTDSMAFESGFLNLEERLAATKKRLAELDLFSQPDFQEKYFQLFAFISDYLSDHGRLEEFENYLSWVGDRTDPDFVARLFGDVYVSNIYPRGDLPGLLGKTYLLSRKLKAALPNDSEQRVGLSEIEADLWRRCPGDIYPLRPELVSPELIARFQENPAEFWPEMFRQLVALEMERLFKGQPRVKGIYETAANSERKLLPDLIVIFGHIFGLEPSEVIRLAAIGCFDWAAIIERDDTIDDGGLRKGRRPMAAQEGVSRTIRMTTIAQAAATRNLLPLWGKAATDDYCQMVQQMYDADMELEETGLAAPDDQIWQAMDRLNSAFSWFINCMAGVRARDLESEAGQRFIEAGQSFSEFMSRINMIAQLKNDFEDWNQPPGKKKPGEDFGHKFSLPLRELLKLVSPKERATILEAYANPKDEEIKRQALEIAKLYQPQVIAALKPRVEEIYEKARLALEKGFEAIAGFRPMNGGPDRVNQTYQQLLGDYLDSLRDSLCQLGKSPQGQPV
ncbi:MAG TPA: hypothetical protein VMW41_02700 [Candidatus Bathyarchaeia archaeon]|nr:hypothetical protein [Candidatus Bathyarchaeia archaeon]